MKVTALPTDANDHLSPFESEYVLDTREEPAFAALTQLAALILEAPVTSISLPASDRAWFESRYGFELVQGQRDASFCRHVVWTEAPLVVPDAADDERFAGLRGFAGEPRIRFYVAVPLRTPDGFVFGILCGLAYERRELTLRQLEMLSLVAGQIVELLEARRKVPELAARRASAVEEADQLSRLVTAGALAVGVGHEINNPLSFVVSNLELVGEELHALDVPAERSAKLSAILDRARQGADRIRRIVNGLGTLAREEADPIPTDVTNAVDSSVEMAQHELRYKATVVKDLAPESFVLADESRLGQVLVNLLTNAAQAFPSHDLQKNLIHVASSKARDGRVAITVSDNGPGIPPDLLRRIFEPFFTTKSVGTGTGLGLSISRNIVRALGGELSAQSEVGRGTTFRILLPTAEPRPIRDSESVLARASVRGRILVIDDEQRILSTIQRVLEREHDVVCIDDPERALEVLERGEHFDAILCDLMMPTLGGDELFAELQHTNPALADRFVFMTGGTSNAELEQFLAGLPNERLDKPFSVQALREVARRLTERA